MTKECCARGNNMMILACSGGSNVGQLSKSFVLKAEDVVSVKEVIRKCFPMSSKPGIESIKREKGSCCG